MFVEGIFSFEVLIYLELCQDRTWDHMVQTKVKYVFDTSQHQNQYEIYPEVRKGNEKI
jgi:hypothetical protein